MRNLIRIRFILLLAVLLFSSSVMAKDGKYKKVQNINFDGSAVDGVVRTPDGLYLVQKRGIEFVPLYKVKRKFDESIKESVDYLR